MAQKVCKMRNYQGIEVKIRYEEDKLVKGKFEYIFPTILKWWEIAAQIQSYFDEYDNIQIIQFKYNHTSIIIHRNELDRETTAVAQIFTKLKAAGVL